MKKILVINASARSSESKSRELTEVFVKQWKTINGEADISFRDLTISEVPYITESWIEAAAKKKEERSEADNNALKVSDVYIKELKDADIIVLGSPMYNWSVPGILKAYIDQIVRVNETWKFNHDHPTNPYKGLLEHKTLFLLLARGGTGYGKGEPNEHMNFQNTYLELVFQLIGIQNIHTVAIDGVSVDPEKLYQRIENAYQSIKNLIANKVYKNIKTNYESQQ
ncbi:NAD(P)H-dependent oxidoreductase [Flavobacterium sp. MMLR14_040]|jgi:FMN-dependent NADH-azoreductase|uniref:FMN-dependent NADH-azoreductase n=1 Tax=Flavobacterium sp. MMLR14_040 TaxID=3093843 RepID=UPI000EB37AE9|nr:NAD(P)H-dependent oxidoreductase [Flavobacterium sp. MMLR14_040]MDW8848953.1 NAD(P)H-dependent oxidoreductase [Flavobacterium sp. MMLR14_040]